MIEILTAIAMHVIPASARDPAADAFARKVIAAHAKPLEQDQVFYRWQSTESGENLVRSGTMNQTTNAYFMGQKRNIVAGPGVYMASSELSSASYLPDRGGNLIEVRIPKGTPVLDVHGLVENKVLSGNDAEIFAIFHGDGGSTPVVMRFTEDWFVGKNLADHAAIPHVPGPSPHSSRDSGRD